METAKSKTTSDNPFEPLCSRCNDTHRIAVHSLRMPPFGTMPDVGTPQASGTDIEISYAPCPECRAQKAMTDPKTTAPRRVWIVRPAFAMNHQPIEVGPEDDLADLVERAMDASPTSEVVITQDMRK